MVRGSVESLDLAGIFSTYPNPHISVAQAFLVEMVITAILLCLILALTGFALNPARDFGPKTFAFLAGWGKVAYTGGREIPYFLVPLIAPVVGACLGAFGYRALIGPHLPGQLSGEEADGVAVAHSRATRSEPKA